MMRQFFSLSSCICCLTSCMVLPTPGCTLVPPLRFPQQFPACLLGTFLAKITIATVTRTTKNHQPVTAWVSTIEPAGALILHP